MAAAVREAAVFLREFLMKHLMEFGFMVWL